ncbi:MAG: PEP-CTERM sorting domain-containing protein [Phycisphaerae bacterium]|nr:PEP-CTERM sorting domain-containing protein [Phycisphaerae bacterium]
MQIPEPATLVLLMGGALPVLLRRKSKIRRGGRS